MEEGEEVKGRKRRRRRTRESKRKIRKEKGGRAGAREEGAGGAGAIAGTGGWRGRDRERQTNRDIENVCACVRGCVSYRQWRHPGLRGECHKQILVVVPAVLARPSHSVLDGSEPPVVVGGVQRLRRLVFL